IFVHPFGFDGVVQIDRNLRWEEFPIISPAEFESADDAHRYNWVAELNCHPEDARIKWGDAAIARARPFGEDNQADAFVQGLSRHFHHPFVIGQITFRRDWHVAEPAHHPTIGRNLEMRFVFESSHELRNCRIDDEGVPDVYMVADKETGPLSVETRRIFHFEIDSCYTQDIAEQPPLRFVIVTRIDDVA